MAQRFLTPIDLGKLELLNARLQNLAVTPTAPVVGQMFYDTVNLRPLWWNGTAWTNVASDTPLLGGQAPAHYLNRANHTGTQSADTVTDYQFADASFDTRVRTSSLSEMAPLEGNLSVSGYRIVDLATPVGADDAATKRYVDSRLQGLDTKESVKYATSEPLPVYNRTGNVLTSSGTGRLFIGGTAVSDGDRLLVKDETNAAHNGIYVVTDQGSAATAWQIERAADFDEASEISPAAFVFVEEGAHAASGWTLSAWPGAFTLNTTGLTWVQFSEAGQITAGDGLTFVGTVLNVNGAVSVMRNSSTGTEQRGGILADANSIAIDADVVVRKASSLLGSGTGTEFYFQHNLGTYDVTVCVFEAAAPRRQVYTDVEVFDTDTVIVRFNVAPAQDAYRVVVHG